MTKPLGLLTLLFSLLPFATVAQETPISADGSTATQVITNNGNNFDIDGGDRAGGNLFHSFGRFSVPGGGSANFLNSPDIQNILSRVTGGNISTIDGLIKANGAANLFLINPAGIVFGAGASLNIGGSFLGSTADSLLFNDGTEFSAVNAQGKPLLTINAPIGFSVRDNPNPINVNSQAGLRVQPGKNVTLVGGNLNFDGGKIFAPGGRIELGSLGGASKISINENGSLTFPEGITRGDINLANDSEVNVRAGGGGFIGVNARNLEISGKSQIIAGIDENLGSPDAIAGDININTTDSVTLIGEKSAYLLPDDQYPKEDLDKIKEQRVIDTYSGTTIRNNVGLNSIARGEGSDRSSAQGKSGNININTGNLKLVNVASIDTSLFGSGVAGNINIDAKDISAEGGRSLITTSAIKTDPKFTRIKDLGIGDAGDVNINTRSLSLKDVSQIVTNLQSEGSAGDINVNTETLTLQDRSKLNSGTKGKGNAGNITVKAKDITQNNDGSMLAWIENNAVGNAGNIDITTDNLSMDKSFILTMGLEGAIGDTGNININASGTILMDGGSNFITQVSEKGVGNAGNIDVTANNLIAKQSNFFGTKTFGIGNAGNVKIKVADRLDFFRTTIITQSEDVAVGNAGNIDISAGSISFNGILGGGVRERTLLIADAKTKGNGGNITINATKDLTIDGNSIIITQVQEGGDGKAGDIIISSPSISLNNFSFIATSLGGFQGVSDPKPGNIKIDTNDLKLANGSIIVADTENFRDGGSININTKNLTLNSGGKITTSTKNIGNAGNIAINASENISLDGSNLPSISLFTNQPLDKDEARTGIFADTSAEATGNGGNIEINNPNSFNLTNNAQVGVDSLGQGNGGKISIQTNSLKLDRNASILASARFGEGGDINLRFKDILSLRNNSKISAQSLGDNQGGNITIDVSNGFIVAFPNQDNDILASSETRGGNISINVQKIYGFEKSGIGFNPQERANILNNGKNNLEGTGDISIQTPDLNPTQGFILAPENIVTPEEVSAQVCSASGNVADANSFTITGRGGLPEDPTKPLNAVVIAGSSQQAGEAGEAGEAEGDGETEKWGEAISLDEKKKPLSSDEIIPARGVAYNEKGQVVLTRYPTPNTTERNYSNAIDCNGQT
jgi:filamentous hemagglutinin family protein